MKLTFASFHPIKYNWPELELIKDVESSFKNTRFSTLILLDLLLIYYTVISVLIIYILMAISYKSHPLHSIHAQGLFFIIQFIKIKF